MITTSFLRRLVCFSAAAALAVLSVPVLRADHHEGAGDHKKQLPLETSFGRGTPGEHGGPFAVTLKNTGSADLKVKATVIQSVASHNKPRNIDLEEKTIAAGQSWTINDLAVQDRVVVKSPGYEKLELTVPAADQQDQAPAGKKKGKGADKQK